MRAPAEDSSSARLDLTVILPTYNERGNVPVLIADILRSVRDPVRVLVVDDDSPDGTWQIVEQLAAADARVGLIRRTTERGLTSAIWSGIRAADTAAVSWMDVDLAMPADVIPKLIARLEAGADIAVGSRYIPGGSDPGHSLMARSFSIVINRFATVLLRAGVHDYTSGFIAARRRVFDTLELRGDYGEYCIDLLARAAYAGLTIAEVPYTCGARHSGESKTGASFTDYIRRGAGYVRTVLRLSITRR